MPTSRFRAIPTLTIVVLIACVCRIVSAALPVPILHYTFDEASSGATPALDTGSGTAANGTFAGGATRITNTPSGTGAALDLTANSGIGNWISAGNVSKIDSLTSFTISMWVNLRASTSNTAILASDGVPFQNGWAFNIGGVPPSTTYTSLELWSPSSGDGQGSVTPVDADDQWVMFAATYDGSTDDGSVYAGSLTSKMQATGQPGNFSPGLLPSTASFLVGYELTSPPSAFKIPAYIDDVRVYGTALSLSQLETIRQSVPEPCTGVVLFGTLLLSFRPRTSTSRQTKTPGCSNPN